MRDAVEFMPAPTYSADDGSVEGSPALSVPLEPKADAFTAKATATATGAAEAALR